MRYYSRKSITILYIGTGFLGTALLDGYHTIVTSHFFAPFLPSDLPSLIPWSWIASRMYLSLLLWLSWLAWYWRDKSKGSLRARELSVYGMTAVLTLASFLFVAFVPLPKAYYSEFIFHRPEEFVPALFFLMALVGYLRKGDWRHEAFEHWLVLSLIVGFVAQAVFMSFSGRLFDMEFDAAHMLKNVTYVLVLTGLLISMFLTFRQAEAGAQQLASVNEDLRQEIEVRERAEATLSRRAEELQRSNSDLMQFASVASHDLQEPLRKIQAFGDRLQSKCGDAMGDEGRDYLSRILSAATRMRSLVNGLLNYSRVTTTARPFGPVDLSAVIEVATSDLEARFQEVAGRIEVGDMPVIDADTTQMRQLFMNLIGNSLKYHRKDRPPVVKINCRRDHGALPGALAGRSADGYCEITVSDNGIGFDEKYVDRIFEIFQRLHGRSSYDGTGIGLALCRRIVERYGGTISATSKPGDGATFHVKLPITQLFPELVDESR